MAKLIVALLIFGVVGSSLCRPVSEDLLLELLLIEDQHALEQEILGHEDAVLISELSALPARNDADFEDFFLGIPLDSQFEHFESFEPLLFGVSGTAATNANGQDDSISVGGGPLNSTTVQSTSIVGKDSQ